MGRIGHSNLTWEVKVMAKFTQMAPASSTAKDGSGSRSGLSRRQRRRRRRRRRRNRSNT